mmetsp:Transcript_914/g.1368  ORF Transcript_914/g.1368 Transcript_914/m.1368 type:complete len:80 (+) Transcript_914:147-386(+)
MISCSSVKACVEGGWMRLSCEESSAIEARSEAKIGFGLSCKMELLNAGALLVFRAKHWKSKAENAFIGKVRQKMLSLEE